MPMFSAHGQKAKFSKVQLYPSDDAEAVLSPTRGPRGNEPRLKSILKKSAIALGAFAAIALVAVKLSSFRAARADATEIQEIQEIECVDSFQDCRASKCCKQSGQTCFAKNEYWAACLTTCTHFFPGDAHPAPWSCEALGETTPEALPSETTPEALPSETTPEALPSETTPEALHCTWAGSDCSQTRRCCQRGFECAIKDENWQSCVQVETFDGKPVDIPPGWLGTKLGGWNSEKEVTPALVGATLKTSMYCFMAILAGSAEEQLAELAKKKKAGIFACEDSSIYHSAKSKYNKWNTGVATLVNTDVFVDIWLQVRADGKYMQQDWTVKADADCVFLPDRLRQHLAALFAPRDQPIYVKNTMDKFTNGGFLGALEVLSSSAVGKFVGHARECEKYIGTQSGEDGFLKDCMDAIGIGFMKDELLMHPSGLMADCQVAEFASYHPFKSVFNWTRCYDHAQHLVPKEHLFGGSLESLPVKIRGLYAAER